MQDDVSRIALSLYIVVLNDEYSAIEFFKYKGEDYAAYILYDYSGNPPEFTFYLMQEFRQRSITAFLKGDGLT